MSADTALAMATILTPFATAVSTVWLSHRLSRVDSKADAAKDNAALAAARSEPTGNGFAQHTRDAFQRLEAEAKATRDDIGGIRGDIGGIRADVRILTKRVDRIDTTVSNHLQEGASRGS